VGDYAVTFPGNGGDDVPEAILVSAYGGGNERCKPASKLTGDVVRVRCWSGAAGPSVAADSKFTVALVDRGRAPQRTGVAFVEEDDVLAGNTSISRTDGYNSSNLPILIQRRDLGLYDLTFVGLAPAGSPQQFGAHVADMDDNDAAYCSVVGWRVIGQDLVVTVQCWNEEDGTPDDDTFYLIMTQ
jgi:hypothetical protein